MDALQSEYETLKASILAVQNQIEDRNQSIHNCKNELALATARKIDYQDEIEALKRKEKDELASLQKTIHKLEFDMVKLQNYFNPVLVHKSEQIESLRNEIRQRTQTTNKKFEENKKSQAQIKADLERNRQLKLDVDVLKSTGEDVQANLDLLQLQNVALQKDHDNLQGELEEVKLYHACKAKELVEAKNLIQKTQEEIFLTKLELESLKSNPLDLGKKGNSLFAEVDDSRKKTQQEIQQMNTSYAHLKRDVCNKVKQMTTIRARNIELSKQLDTVIDYDAKHEQTIAQLKEKAITLEYVIADHKKDALQQHVFTGKNLQSYAVQFANGQILAKLQEGEKDREALDRTSKERLKTIVEIQSTSSEMRKWRRKALQLKVQVEALEDEILSIQLQNSPTNNETVSTFAEAPIKSPEEKPLLLNQSVKDKPEHNSSCQFVILRKKSTIVGGDGLKLSPVSENEAFKPIPCDSSDQLENQTSDANQLSNTSARISTKHELACEYEPEFNQSDDGSKAAPSEVDVENAVPISDLNSQSMLENQQEIKGMEISTSAALAAFEASPTSNDSHQVLLNLLNPKDDSMPLPGNISAESECTLFVCSDVSLDQSQNEDALSKHEPNSPADAEKVVKLNAEGNSIDKSVNNENLAPSLKQSNIQESHDHRLVIEEPKELNGTESKIVAEELQGFKNQNVPEAANNDKENVMQKINNVGRTPVGKQKYDNRQTPLQKPIISGIPVTIKKKFP